MHSRIALLLLPLLLSSSAVSAKRETAESAYEGARKDYYALKDDAARRKLRHHWLNVARRFEAVASRFPKSERAPEALFTAGELLSELSRISFVEEDLQAAVADYRRLLEAHPKHRLADDAALSLARIYITRLDQPENARRVLTDTIGRIPKGDLAGELKQLLASLPAPAKAAPAAPAPARKAVATKSPEPSAPAASNLVEAITKLAREPSPFVPPTATATATPEPKPDPKAEAPRKVETPAAPAVAAAPVESSTGSEPAAGSPAAKSLDSLVASLTSGAQTAKVEKTEKAEVVQKPKPAATERPPSPITAPVDAQVAQARLKAMAKDSRRADLTLAEQLGLKVRRVVIDAGHGGHDTGAIGKKGTREKDVALAISLKLAEKLRERDLEVLLTRDDDRFIRLEDRARFANEERGDLFISVHCNSAASRKLRGIETYTLNTSADRYSIRLAARENASSEKGMGDLQFILADLATKANTEESSRLAGHVQKSLVGDLTTKYSNIKNLGTKEALFYVLLGTKMPAILVETAFLSHPDEEERLASDAYQDAVAQSIAQGVEEFLSDRSHVAKVD
ncbi:N-acetylmuramoyl-L-alanine amidase [Myxococcaceae bacterium GXIMD 01537]